MADLRSAVTREKSARNPDDYQYDSARTVLWTNR